MTSSISFIGGAALFLAMPTELAAQENTKDVGRIEYSVTPLATGHTPSPHEYVRLRIKIQKFGAAGVLSTKDPNFLGQIFSGIFKKSRYVFVGLRFQNGPFELLHSADATSKSAIPFFTVLYAERGTTTVGPPHTDDNEIVLGPREVGSADVQLVLSTAWGKKVEVKIPGAAWDIASAAAASYVSLPAGLVNSDKSKILSDSDRSAAENYFDSALSFDSRQRGATGPDGLNIIAIANDQLTNGVTVNVSVYDRDATDIDKRQLIVQFALTTEYASSVLPGAQRTPPTDLTQMFATFDPNANIVAGDPTTSVAGVLARVPIDDAYGSPSANMGANGGNFGVACTKLKSYFGQLGFNQYDQYALSWATLQQSDFLKTFAKLSRENQVSAVLSQGGSNCPGAVLNPDFKKVGLSEIPPLQAAPPPIVPETAPPTADMLKTLYKFAHDWANPAEGKIATYVDPDQANQFDLVRDSNNRLQLSGDGPTTPAELANALGMAPSRIGAFAHSSSKPRRWCITYTVGGAALQGSIRFSATNAQIIDEIDMGNAAPDCAN